MWVRVVDGAVPVSAVSILRSTCKTSPILHSKHTHTHRAIERSPHVYFSVPPSVVRSPQKQKLVAALPLDRLVLETDAPALGPVAGEVNRPANIAIARDAIARIKGVSADEVVRTTTANALRLFPRLLQRLQPDGSRRRRDGGIGCVDAPA